MLPILISTPHCSGHVPHWLLARMLRTGEDRAALERRLQALSLQWQPSTSSS